MQKLPTQPTVKAPAETFTGDAWYDVIARAAAPDHFMTHLAIWEAPAEGPESEWGEHVSEAEYLAQPTEPTR
ncbi:MAG TPA: hypothetical protein VIK12_10435 [Pengzhenrongella sp.]